MRVEAFDFGAEDARNLKLRNTEQKDLFLDTYVLPRGFQIEDFYDGNRYFVYGAKGAGKTALLQYIRLKAERELGALCGFYYFQSAFSHDDLKVFLATKKGQADGLIDDTNISDPDEASLFWRVFILIEVAKLLRKAKIFEGSADVFYRLVESAKLIAQAKNVGKRYPNLQNFSVTLSKNPEIHLEGTFETATPSDLLAYLDLADEALEDVYLDESPMFLFIDEMETYLKGDKSDELRLASISSLIRAIRDFNERYRDIDVRIVAAVRDEVVKNVSVVQGEVYRIISDNGVELDWHHTVKSGFHPLEKMVLQRLIAQDRSLDWTSGEFYDDLLHKALKKYFPRNFGLRKVLNLTWYRPRDIALLFEEAARIDQGLDFFRQKTLEDDVIKPLGKRMWRDAISGLAIKYKQSEILAIDRILRGGASVYTRDGFFSRAEELSHQYDEVALLSDSKWIEVLEDLYNVGVMYSVSPTDGHKNFSFRGNPMPSLSGVFSVGVHQALLKELSIS